MTPRRAEAGLAAIERSNMSDVHIGCSGWNYDDWKGRLYPASAPRRRWLEIYAQSFDTVEVNATFYRLARREAVANWVQQTPAGFLFAVKASRYLTHVKRLRDVGDSIKRFYEPLEPLQSSGRLAAVLWQLPENFHRDDQRLAHLLEQLPAGRHTIEFRHESWFANDVMATLAAHDVALTLGDHPQRPFQSAAATAGWRYLRFHYAHRGRNGNYSQSELDTWGRRIAQWRRRHEVFAYFNNDWCGYAPRNADALRQRLGGRAGGVA
jgi:uncharacterized protein YecE (DUF72 family)